MSTGTPVLFGADSQGRRFKALAAISTRRDDLNSFDEGLLQSLIEETPDVLPVREFLPSAARLFSLGREVPVDLGGSEGFIDNLLVTNDGYVVIVETKLYRNPEATRDVVAQTLQYCMAVGRMPMLELESRIRRGQNPALGPQESIRDALLRLTLAESGAAPSLSDDFEEALERNLRRGEILMLVASDGIRISVERVAHWLNEQGSSAPFKFGLVEMKFYALGDQRVVIPRTVLRTREVSRHVVVVDIQPNTEMGIVAQVTDQFLKEAGGKVQDSRSLKIAAVPLTKTALLQSLADEQRSAASTLIAQLESVGLDQAGTGSTLKFGFADDSGGFHSLVALDRAGAWAYVLKKDATRLGSEGVLQFRKDANQFGRFYREDQLLRPDSFGCAVKFSSLADTAAAFAAFLSGYFRRVADQDESDPSHELTEPRPDSF